MRKITKISGLDVLLVVFLRLFLSINKITDLNISKIDRDMAILSLKFHF